MDVERAQAGPDADSDGEGALGDADTRPKQSETTIDPAIIRDLNDQANAVAESLTHLMGGLHVQLLAISSITLQSVEVYGMGVDQVGKTVDKCVEDTLALITKADELNANMAPIHELATQIKEIKRTLDVLEAACK